VQTGHPPGILFIVSGVDEALDRQSISRCGPVLWARAHIWLILSLSMMCAYFVFGLHMLDIAIANHVGGLATSIMDGVDSLGLSGKWELQANLRESRIWMHMMMWGFWPIDGLFSLFFGDTWTTLYLGLVVSLLAVALSGFLVWRYVLVITRDERTAFLVALVFFLLPAAFINTIHWYGQPVFVLLVFALFAMKRGWNWVAVPLVIWAHGCHPMATPVFLGLAISAFGPRLPGIPESLMPGVDRKSEQARRSFRFAVALCLILAVWTAFLVVMSRMGNSTDQRGLLWDFFKGKFDPAVWPLNLMQTFYFLLPMLLLPLFNLTWLPAFGFFLAYVVLGSQGIVTGFLLPGAGLAAASFGHFLRRFKEATRVKLALSGVALALLANLLVPWTVFFPLGAEPLTGGLFSYHSWHVRPREAAINQMVSDHIPAGTARCLTTWQIGPSLASRCDRITTLSFPFRRDAYTMRDFLDTGDRGRIESGGWDFILVDLHREHHAEGLDELLQRILSFGRWEVVGDTGDALLFRNTGSATALQ